MTHPSIPGRTIRGLLCAVALGSAFLGAAYAEKIEAVTVKKIDSDTTLVTTQSGERLYLGREYVVVRSDADRDRAIADLNARIAALDAIEDEVDGREEAKVQRAKEDLKDLRADLKKDRDFDQRRYENRLESADNVIESTLRTAGNIAETGAETAGEVAKEATDTAGDIAESAADTAGDVVRSIGRGISRMFD